MFYESRKMFLWICNFVDYGEALEDILHNGIELKNSAPHIVEEIY